MKTHPILFSTPMIQAILAGNKTMTRRIVKDQKSANIASEYPKDDPLYLFFLDSCRYGYPNDFLWVRESFDFGCMGGYIYKADHTEYELKECKHAFTWKPSIHMPKAACRLFLKITDIRVERLQDITEEDAIKEGVEYDPVKKSFGMSMCYKSYVTETFSSFPYVSFKTLWQKINGRDQWESNPWVWVISFERVDKPENF